MDSLIRRIGAKVLKTGLIDRADIDRLRAYAARHPMWVVTAREETVTAYKALLANAGVAA